MSTAYVVETVRTDQAIALADATKVYGRGAAAVTALADVTVAFPRGSFTAVMGPSGSGKSTFLNVASGLDRPTSGSVHLAGADLSRLNETRLTTLRRQHVGFIFQAFNLLPALTVEQNITLPARLSGHRADRAWVREVVERVGLGQRLRHRPAELSGGQQQRVAVARALVMRPEVLFADEPTGALDNQSGRETLSLLRQSVNELGQTIVMVTHDPVAAAYADSVLFLVDGRTVGTLADPTPERVADRMTHLEG